MKDYAIDIAAISNKNGTSAYACQARGTLSERPLLTNAQRRHTATEAAFTGAINALDDLSIFLSEGDCVDINLKISGADVLRSISTGSGNAKIDMQMRALVIEMNHRGISIAMYPETKKARNMAMKAEMALALAS
jgi:hypothetical protein